MKNGELTNVVIGYAIEVHRLLGPGLLESVYRSCLAYELKNSGLKIEEEKVLPIRYKNIVLDRGYRIDLLIENKLVLELKTVEFFTDVHVAQILTYMRLSGNSVGLLLNFQTAVMKNGIRRFIL